METLSEEEQQKERKRIEISDEIKSLRMLIIAENKKKGFFTSRKELATLIHLYKEKRAEIKQYLPKIKDLLVDGILCVVATVHGMVDTGPLPFGDFGLQLLDYVKIPKSMILFKGMASDYGSSACDVAFESHHSDHSRTLDIISKNIKSRKDKGTRRNNIKFMKKTMKEINTLLKSSMNISKKKMASNRRYIASKIHIHSYMNDGKIVNKDHEITLTDDDWFDRIDVVNNKYHNVNLVHYIDVNIFDDRISFKTQDIFNLFKHIKYVLYVDHSCSGGSVLTNFGQSMTKRRAEAIEGKSITNNIDAYNNTSPYNTNDVYEREQLNKPSRSQENNLNNNHHHARKRIPLFIPNEILDNIYKGNSNYTTSKFFSRRNKNFVENFKVNLKKREEEARLTKVKQMEEENTIKRAELEKKRAEEEEKRAELEKKRAEKSEESKRKYESRQKNKEKK